MRALTTYYLQTPEGRSQLEAEDYGTTKRQAVLKATTRPDGGLKGCLLVAATIRTFPLEDA